ncbi:cytochrome P450 [Salinarimonas ramus]|uniref:Cytochrome P450 n=1 Tax=Salinarimonas ramus TaxID=690164 RepID=A0A917QG98_9HYPH|nr:cytochrome P450 [Salinarimonas ramus]GGK49302.1 cytochrome P450 [Salinarimonas ramus]
MDEPILARPRFSPPAPTPMREPPDLFSFLRQARDNPLATWTRDHFEKPVVYGKGVLGRVMVLSEPRAIRHVLVENAENYRKDALTRRVLAPGLGQGLFTAEGEDWRTLRRTLAPMFSPRHVASFAEPMAVAARRLTRRLARREGRTVDVEIETTRLTLDVLERTIFTSGLERDPDALGRAITKLFAAIGPVDPLDVLGLPEWLPRLGRIQARPSIDFFARVVDELIGTRRALVESGAEVPRDLLTLLLEARDPETGEGLDDLDVRANIVTFIGAGHETTANALTWALYLVSQAPDVRARLEAEVDTVVGEGPVAAEHAGALPWTKAVIEETMRLYPPAAFMSREAIAEDRVAGIRLPAGAIVMIAPWVLHRHTLIWDDPAAFDPTRFFGEARGRIDRYAYLPFGAGPRVCIGAAFALQEAVLALAEIVRAVRLDLAPEAVVEPVQRVTLRPRNGMPMRVTRRAG